MRVGFFTVVTLGLIAFGLFSLTPSDSTIAHPARADVVITVGDDWFCDPSFEGGVCSKSAILGDTVIWQWGPGGSGTDNPHTSTNCADDLNTCGGPREWDSNVRTSGTFSHTFGPEDAGKTFLYRCQVHPNDMRGQIVVQAAPTPTSVPLPPTPTSVPPPPTPTSVQPPQSTPTSAPPPTPTGGQPTGGQPTGDQPAGGQTTTPTPASAPTPTPVPTDALSPTPSDPGGSAPDGDGSISAWWFALIGIAGGLALIAGTLFVRRRYRP